MIVAVIALSTTGGCGMPHLLYGKRVAGQVVDAETGEPIAGAHVALLWEAGIIPTGFTGHNSRDICFHAAATTTDAQGHFDISGWWKWKTYNVYNVDPFVLVYTKNYVPLKTFVEPAPDHRPRERLHERYTLKRFSGNVDQRLDMLFWGLANRGCDYGDESQKSLFPMMQTIHAEARQIARTNEQLATVRIIGELAADAGLGVDLDKPVDDAKTKAFIKEHLR
ncbi:MAG TPA: carboxypeptidase-like regulatory domain-containing protein [Casimicrobiaceae bacterium]|nr:carboxypeptidase-like regulatory domain-containing protein [Casimicrobiaceae bacterium]